MSEQRPCRYQVGDRVIYGGASGCAPMYEGYGATVVAIWHDAYIRSVEALRQSTGYSF